jgi:F0F1-type ATP synthase epsilon subunit
MQFELVSPERNLASLDAASVKVPGADGDMTVMMVMLQQLQCCAQGCCGSKLTIRYRSLL